MMSACDSSPSSCLMRPSMKPCCSRAAWYSAFALRSPWARASAIAAMTAGRLTDFSSSSSARRRCAPAMVMGALMKRSSGVLTQFFVQFLQRQHRAAAAIVQRMQQGLGPGNRGRIGHALLQCLAADRERVRDRLAALGGVDDIGDLAVLDQVDDVRTTFQHLVDQLALDPVLAQPLPGAGSGNNGVAASDQ